MSSSANVDMADIRVRDVILSEDELSVALMDGRTITVPLAWYTRLANGAPLQRANWQVSGGSYCIHWPDLDEDLDTEGLLTGRRAPIGSENLRSPCCRSYLARANASPTPAPTSNPPPIRFSNRPRDRISRRIRAASNAQ